MRKTPRKPLFALFYYDRRKLRLLFLANLAGLALVIVFGHALFAPFLPAGLFAVLLCFCSLLAAAYVYFFPQKLAIVTDEDIRLDRCHPLKWKNIAAAEETAIGPFRRRIIILKPTADFGCRLTFMQHVCRHLRFTAFSVPLYAMTDRDGQKIKEIIAERTTFSTSKETTKND